MKSTSFSQSIFTWWCYFSTFLFQVSQLHDGDDVEGYVTFYLLWLASKTTHQMQCRSLSGLPRENSPFVGGQFEKPEITQPASYCPPFWGACCYQCQSVAEFQLNTTLHTTMWLYLEELQRKT